MTSSRHFKKLIFEQFVTQNNAVIKGFCMCVVTFKIELESTYLDLKFSVIVHNVAYIKRYCFFD